MSDSTIAVSIQVLDKEYLISCPPSEKEGLLQSAAMLDRRMREVRESGKILGAERVAVITALNVIHESRMRDADHRAYVAGIDSEMSRLSQKLAEAVGRRAGNAELD